MHINIEVFSKLILSFWVCVAGYAQKTQNEKFAYLCNTSRKTLIVSFYKLIVSLWVCEARHAHSTQSNKFTISLQYLKKNVKGEIDLSPTDKIQRFLQVGTIILSVCGQACPNYRKIRSFLFFCSSLRKK